MCILGKRYVARQAKHFKQFDCLVAQQQMQRRSHHLVELASVGDLLTEISERRKRMNELLRGWIHL